MYVEENVENFVYSQSQQRKGSKIYLRAVQYLSLDNFLRVQYCRSNLSPMPYATRIHYRVSNRRPASSNGIRCLECHITPIVTHFHGLSSYISPCAFNKLIHDRFHLAEEELGHNSSRFKVILQHVRRIHGCEYQRVKEDNPFFDLLPL